MFNQKSRTENMAKNSVIGSVCKITNLLAVFAYRTVFIRYFSVAYLGLEGVFSNVLTLLSFAEMNIGPAISYRLYEPISRGDILQVGRWMCYYKRIYRRIACTVLTLGMAIFPFLEYFVKDVSEIPPDISMQLVYLLFLTESVASYLFVTPQTLLAADQRQYLQFVYQIITKIIRCALQIAIMALTRNYIYCLTFTIFFTVITNLGWSACIVKHYPEVFRVKETLSEEERRALLRDTRATLCHKVGNTVLNGTDSVVISRFIGLVVAGLYANYTLLIGGISNMIWQVFGSLTANFGNAHCTLSKQEGFRLYRHMRFVNFVVGGLGAVCILLCVSDFIGLWAGSDMTLGQGTVVAVSIQFYLSNSRQVTGCYIYGVGLFVKDKLRGFIEAGLNLAISIFLAIKIGITGVVIGTIASHLMTCAWREPYILYRYEFGQSTREYWRFFTRFTLTTAATGGGLLLLKQAVGFCCNGFVGLIAEVASAAAGYCGVIIAVFARSEELEFLLTLVCKAVNRLCPRYKVRRGKD